MDPPVVPAARLGDWQPVAETTDTPFAAGFVSVVAHTRRYEPPGATPPHPFFFATRLDVRPRVPPNAALSRIVERGAREGFRSTLAERGVADLSRGESRSIAVEDPDATTATLTTFRGTYRPDGTDSVPVIALLAVWEADGYLAAGGAVPARTADEQDAARRRLLSLLRGVRPA